MARIKTDNITDVSPVSLKGISISLASPESIMLWSYAERKGRERGEEGLGEVEFPETINYRTQRPERGDCFARGSSVPRRTTSARAATTRANAIPG